MYDIFQVCDYLLKEYKANHNTATGKRADHGTLVLCKACCDGLGCTKEQCSELINRKCYKIFTCIANI